ncbi:hypothetical protein [Acinetobacter sp. ANC 3813]|uniref:hypothetical protein n=1 Tax=Acinetobacter sp. ANC 3813 TaxID=1977873 RepID=UPI000A3443FC|nr:hypothetical protein [Acinetobacter sp. ANC 3813]OTG88893.1 hypothetical protein B9T34_14110 [Acinetobacter sp. ANC 3813]
MRPCSRKALKTEFRLQDIGLGSKNTIAGIKGSTKKLGEKYSTCLVVLYNKANLQPIALRKPDENGDYQFLGLNTDLKTFIVAFDINKQYNAVIQDNVVPK